MSTQFSAVLATDIATAILDRLDTDGAGSIIRFVNSGNTTLAEVPLDFPCGAVNPTTGALTFDIDGRDESANASGTAAFGLIVDANGTVHLKAQVRQGTAAQSGFFTMASTYIQIGQPVEVASLTYTPGPLIS
jgi:hypothetical protein